MRRLTGTGVAGGMVTTVLAAGWLGALVLLVTGALCWVLADPERAPRLALLITAWRGPARSARPVRAARPVRPVRNKAAAG